MLRLSERNLKFPIWDLRNTSDYPTKELRPIREYAVEPRVTGLRLRNNFVGNIEDYWRALLEGEQVHRNEYLRFIGTTLPDTCIDTVACNLSQAYGGKVSNRGWLMI